MANIFYKITDHYTGIFKPTSKYFMLRYKILSKSSTNVETAIYICYNEFLQGP